VALTLAALPFAGCGETGTAQQVREIAVNVVTLQTGTTSELRDRRGTGPFRDYAVAPDEMVQVLEDAMRRAAGDGKPPWVEVYASKRYREVVAKEFEEPSASYKDPFRTAAIAIVHPVPEDPQRCRVEMHDVRRGPFHGGAVRWREGLPGWIEAELADRAGRAGRAAGRLKRIP
jgi:hypothetical protein